MDEDQLRRVLGDELDPEVEASAEDAEPSVAIKTFFIGASLK